MPGQKDRLQLVLTEDASSIKEISVPGMSGKLSLAMKGDCIDGTGSDGFLYDLVPPTGKSNKSANCGIIGNNLRVRIKLDLPTVTDLAGYQAFNPDFTAQPFICFFQVRQGHLPPATPRCESNTNKINNVVFKDQNSVVKFKLSLPDPNDGYNYWYGISFLAGTSQANAQPVVYDPMVVNRPPTQHAMAWIYPPYTATHLIVVLALALVVGMFSGHRLGRKYGRP